MPNAYTYPSDVLNSAQFKAITAGGMQTAITSICTQLAGFRFSADVFVCVQLVYDLIEDILRTQTHQSPVPVLPAAAVAENLITDATTATAMGNIRTYLNGIGAVTVPPIGQLPLKNAFGPLAARIVEAI